MTLGQNICREYTVNFFLSGAFMEVIDIIKTIIPQIEAYDVTISRKFSIALEQLERAKSIEEYQQIGIIIRDVLIEFSQSIYEKKMHVEGVIEPSNSDAKKMIEYTLTYYSINQPDLMAFVKSCWSYSVAIQHDQNTKKEWVVQALSVSCLCLLLIMEAITKSNLYNKRPYYKCPHCGSLDLEFKERWEREVDGEWKTPVIVCSNCKWFILPEMGGMSGIGYTDD